MNPTEVWMDPAPVRAEGICGDWVDMPRSSPTPDPPSHNLRTQKRLQHTQLHTNITRMQRQVGIGSQIKTDLQEVEKNKPQMKTSLFWR